jgi:hypothetical protein
MCCYCISFKNQNSNLLSYNEKNVPMPEILQHILVMSLTYLLPQEDVHGAGVTTFTVGK